MRTQWVSGAGSPVRTACLRNGERIKGLVIRASGGAGQGVAGETGLMGVSVRDLE